MTKTSALAVASAGVFLLTSCSGNDAAPTTSVSSSASGGKSATIQPPIDVPDASSAGRNTTVMTPVRGYTGELSTKSVDASGHGFVMANNMIYKHTITLFNAKTAQRIVDIPDTVNLKDFGLSGKDEVLKGGPVEGVWSKDGKYAYVSNYVMSGGEYKDEPNDSCKGTEKYKPSYVYRINIDAKKIDEVIPVGAVPKYVALTPNEDKLLVSNWCSYSLGVVDIKAKKMTQQIKIATWPRGIAVDPGGRYVYVAAYGTKNVYRVDLTNGTAGIFAVVGQAARHVTLSPDAKYLYAVASHSNSISKIDRSTGKILGQLKGLREPRSLTISPDGTSIYVVNYLGRSVTKVDTATMTKRQVVVTSKPYPIGITYEPVTGQVWVANYDGSIDVFDDNKTGVPPKAPLTAANPTFVPPVAP